MFIERPTQPRPLQVIVVGNEKGGSGKSTVAMHIAVALLKAGRRVATIDMDSRQKTFSTYLQNRQEWAKHVGRDLEVPTHFCLDEMVNFPSTEDRAAASKALTDAVDTMMSSNDFVVIDTPGHDSHLMRLAHSMADILITPLNDSFVDFDVLGTVDPETFAVTDIGTIRRWWTRRDASAKSLAISRLTGLYCETGCRRLVRATSASWARAAGAFAAA